MTGTFWDDRYAEPGLAYGTEPNGFLVSVAHLIPPGPVLCIAEGEGRNALYLASLGHETEAVDASAVGMAKARALAEERGLTLRTTVADLEHYDLGRERWAGIVSIFGHFPPALRRKVHRAVVEGLRPEGVFVAEAYTPAQLRHATGGPRSVELLYDAAMLQEDLEGLDLVRLEEVEREIHEGRYHAGTSAVVQVVGVKR